MPTKRNVLVFNFEGGMVDRVKQDGDYEETMLKWQAPQYRSALWLENYDPSVVRGLIVKRFGSALLREYIWTAQAGLKEVAGGTDYSTSGNPTISFDIDRYTTLVQDDPSASLTQAEDYCTVLGSLNIDYNRPVGQQVLVTFLRDLTTETVDIDTDQIRESTRIVAYVRQQTNGTLTWREPHINGETNPLTGTVSSPAPAVFPGWKISGTLTDVTRHGGSLIITTDVATDLHPGVVGYTMPWFADMYPCYVWTYWDLRRKRDDNEFWNGVNELGDLGTNYTTDEKYGLFKVVYPSLWLARNSLVDWKVYSSAYGNPIVNVTVDSSEANDFLDIHPTLEDEPAKPIEVAIMEFRGRKYSDEIATAVYPGYNEKFTNELEVAFEWVYANADTAYIETAETIRIDSAYSSPFTEHFTVWGYNEPAPSQSAALTWKIDTFKVRITGTEREMSLLHCKGFRRAEMDSPFPEDEDRGTELGLHWVVGTRLPNYLANGSPRPWIQGEKIPMLLTAKVRGAEVVIGEFVHTVASLNAYAYPGLYFLESSQLGWDALDNNNLFEDVQYLDFPEPYWTQFSRRGVFRIYNLRDRILNGNIMAYTPVTSAWLDPFWIGRPTHTEHCIEPFNPTTNPDYVTDFGQTPPHTHPVEDWHIPKNLDNDDKTGHRPKLTEPNYIAITLRIRKSDFPALLEANIEAFKLYVAEQGQDSILRSQGMYQIEEPTAGIYMFPAAEDTESYVPFRLVKTWLTDGKGKPFANHDNIEKWKEQYRGQPTATNAWLDQTDSYIAVGQQETGLPNNRLTPDFVLWDYPSTSPRIAINSSGEYWQGRGARVVTSIKGRTFLGGCLDQYGDEEQGIIRYSDTQAGVITLDVFSKERYLRVGGLPITAMTEYREQLWIFSRHEVHRIQMPNIVDVQTWEYLDKFPGQGAFMPKHVIVTPFGVVWCNASGVWMSDGGLPDNIAAPVLTTYQAMATNAPPYYATILNLPSFPHNDEGWNPYLEISYNERENQLVISTPAADTETGGDITSTTQMPIDEYRLIFDFETKTWHVESWVYPELGDPLNEFDRDNRTTF